MSGSSAIDRPASWHDRLLMRLVRLRPQKILVFLFSFGEEFEVVKGTRVVLCE